MTERARWWLSREHYRRQFGLSAADMDAEPMYELKINQQIWRLREKQKRRESLRDNQ